MARIQATVTPPDAGRRLDRFVQAALGGVPPSLVQRLIRHGKVRRNGLRGRPGDRIAAGDVVEIHHSLRTGDAGRPRAGVTMEALPGQGSGGRARSRPPTARESAPLDPDPAQLTVLHRDAEYLVVDKPAGWPCHTADDAHRSVLGWARAHLRTEVVAGDVRPALAHRIDLGTSGVVVIALTASAVARFQQQLARGQVHKRYVVAVWGCPAADDLRLDTPLQRHEGVGRDQAKMRPARASSGLAALTLCRVVARARTASLLLATPVTGRTHQIRAHLQAAGLPVVGDRRYGDRPRDRAAGVLAVVDHQLLHAQRIAFQGAGGPVTASAPLPVDVQRALELLGLYAGSVEAD